MPRQLTVTELAALRAEIARASEDGWSVTLTKIDGIPAETYVPAPDEEAADG